MPILMPRRTQFNVERNKTVLQFRGLPPGLKSSKRKYGHRQNSVTRVESHKNENVEMVATPGVEVDETAPQFWRLPPELKKLKQKLSHKLIEKQKTRSCKQTKKCDMRHNE